MAVLVHYAAFLSVFTLPYVNSQLTSSVSAQRGNDVTLECVLSDTSFTFPEWRNPSGTKIFDEGSAAKNPTLPNDYASRLSLDSSNNRDLVISSAEDSDAGDYLCSFTGKGDNTITLTVTTPITTDGEDPYCWFCPCWCCIGCWILFLVLLALLEILTGIVIERCCYELPTALKECFSCKTSDCCECCDNDFVRCKCCGSCCNIKTLPFWYYILWWTVICACVSLGMFISRKFREQGNGDVKPKEEKPRHETRSGNTRTGQKKPATKKNESKDSVAHIENEQHNQGKKHREQPPPPPGAGAATGTIMHGREDSDRAVSREHVELQESGRTLTKRPMPDIPRANDRQGHDSKGRGLSANFSDDDHPLISIDIPSKRANALDSLHEVTGGEGPVKELKKKK